jgi:pimeloyl-ACP methyl ester carboxylesterase
VTEAVRPRPATSTDAEAVMVTVRGRRLRVAVRPASGPGPKRTPLLLMNGIGARLEVLQPLVDELRPELEVIRFDVPGVGGSPPPVLPYHYAMLASLVDALVRELGHDRVDVLGFSWGGGLAQQFAVTRARRCRRLVLAATGTGVLMVPARPGVLVHMLTPRRHRDPAYAQSIAGELYGGTMRAHPERAGHVLHATAHSGSLRGYSTSCWPSRAGPACTRCPSSDSPRWCSRRRRPAHPDGQRPHPRPRDPHARLHLHRGGHLALVTEAAELAPVVDAFLSRPERSLRSEHRR